MAEIALSKLTSDVNQDTIKIDWLGERTPVVSSVDVARHFGKKHQHVLRDIERLCSNLPESFHASNFGRMFTEVQIGNGATRKTPAYNTLNLLNIFFVKKD